MRSFFGAISLSDPTGRIANGRWSSAPPRRLRGRRRPAPKTGAQSGRRRPPIPKNLREIIEAKRREEIELNPLGYTKQNRPFSFPTNSPPNPSIGEANRRRLRLGRWPFGTRGSFSFSRATVEIQKSTKSPIKNCFFF